MVRQDENEPAAGVKKPMKIKKTVKAPSAKKQAEDVQK